MYTYTNIKAPHIRNSKLQFVQWKFKINGIILSYHKISHPRELITWHTIFHHTMHRVMLQLNALGKYIKYITVSPSIPYLFQYENYKILSFLYNKVV